MQGLVLSFLIAINPGIPSRSIEEMRVNNVPYSLVTGAALTESLSGRQVFVDKKMTKEPLFVADRELYSPDGLYDFMNHGARSAGHYVIYHDSICLKSAKRSVSCRYLYRAESGKYLFKAIESNFVNHVIIAKGY